MFKRERKLLNVSGLGAIDEQSEAEEKQDRAEHGDHHARGVEAGHRAEADGGSDKPADHGAGYADENRDDDSARITSRQQS